MSSNRLQVADDERQYYFGGLVAKVHGAGTFEVDGVYNMEGMSDGVGKYTYTGEWEGEDCVFYLFRSDNKWNISILPNGVPGGAEVDIHLYKAFGDFDYPPMLGWYSLGDSANPPPQVKMEIMFTTYAIEFKPVAATYDDVLFSEQFSDVTLICSDGESVPAHKCVLAASSPYFKALFSGPWEETQSGQLKMNYPMNIIKAVLSFLYTGKVNVKLVEAEPIAFLSVASEYSLEKWLKVIAEHGCMQALDASNLGEIWQAGRLYQSGLVKKECVEHAYLNSSTVLARGDIQLLQCENPASWEEFSGMMKNVINQDHSITVVFVSTLGEEMYFRMNRDLKLKKAFEKLSQSKELDLTSLRFFLSDGSLIEGVFSCNELRLHDGCKISYEVDEAMDQD